MERTEIGPYRSRWNAHLPSRSAAFWAYLLGPPLVVFAVIAAALAVRTLDQSLGWVAHTREVREHLNATVSALLDAETAQRGYLLTREVSYAEQFSAARTRIPIELESIRLLTADNFDQQATLRDLRPLFDRRLALMARTIALDEAGSRAEALGLVQSGAGRALTGQIRDRLDRMQLEEERLLESRAVLGRRALYSVLGSIFGTGLLALVLIGLLRYLSAREQRRIQETQDELQRSNLELADLTTQLERRVIDRTRELSEANTELEAFARSVAHDLRAPLRTMQGFTTALIEDYASQLPAEGQSFAQRIAISAERMDRLILDLLDYARLSRTEIQIEPVALDQALQTVADELSDDLRRAGGDLAIHVGTWAVMANRTLLPRVLANLISNAFKFVSAGTAPRVDVSAEARGDRVRVWVVDNGIGIAPENQQRIFGVFERLHGHVCFPGSGFGVAIVRRALERMGGTVGVDSLPGRGSRFWFELGYAPTGRTG